MTVTASSFRANFPAFANVKTFPDAQINFWIGIAAGSGTAPGMLNAARWTSMLDYGTQLYVAHNLSLEARNTAEGANSVPPGGNVGPINNKSVDKASAGYDTSGAIDPADGAWNLTNYGTRFIALVKMFGAGPLQIGGGFGGYQDGVNPVGGNPGTAGIEGFTGNAAGAWPGPFIWNFPNQSD